MFLCLILLVSGCTKSKETALDVKVKRTVLEAGETINVCDLIQAVNDEDVFVLNKNELSSHSKSYALTCRAVDTSILGDVVVPFVVNEISVPIKMTVKDTQKPTLVLDKNLKVDAGNQYFDILNEVEVNDSFDLNPSVVIDGYYDIQTKGEYPIIIKAIDSSGNEAMLPILIEVVEKEKEIVVEVVEIEVIKDGTSTSPKDETPVVVKPKPTTTTKPKPSEPLLPSKPPVVKLDPPKVTNPKPASKTWLFADGLSFDEGFEACKKYRNEKMKSFVGTGSCEVLKDAEGNPIGYKATFK